MSPLASAIADWAATRPGPIYGTSLSECYVKAQTLCGLNGKVSDTTFIEALNRCGYETKPRQGFGNAADHFILQMPEKQAGSQR